MTEWQKLTECQMAEFINFSCRLLNIKDYSGIDFADIYEKAISLAPQKTIHNKDYAKCADDISDYFNEMNFIYIDEVVDILKKHFA